MKILKRIVAIFLVVMLCGQSFAAVVSDNDGSAFITKAEFDSLKNNFQAQIDSYNSSIDSKIDGAIASYLSGIQMASEFPQIIPWSGGTVSFGAVPDFTLGGGKKNFYYMPFALAANDNFIPLKTQLMNKKFIEDWDDAKRLDWVGDPYTRMGFQVPGIKLTEVRNISSVQEDLNASLSNFVDRCVAAGIVPENPTPTDIKNISDKNMQKKLWRLAWLFNVCVTEEVNGYQIIHGMGYMDSTIDSTQMLTDNNPRVFSSISANPFSNQKSFIKLPDGSLTPNNLSSLGSLAPVTNAGQSTDTTHYWIVPRSDAELKINFYPDASNGQWSWFVSFLPTLYNAMYGDPGESTSATGTWKDYSSTIGGKLRGFYTSGTATFGDPNNYSDWFSTVASALTFAVSSGKLRVTIWGILADKGSALFRPDEDSWSGCSIFDENNLWSRGGVVDSWVDDSWPQFEKGRGPHFSNFENVNAIGEWGGSITYRDRLFDVGQKWATHGPAKDELQGMSDMTALGFLPVWKVSPADDDLRKVKDFYAPVYATSAMSQYGKSYIDGACICKTVTEGTLTIKLKTTDNTTLYLNKDAFDTVTGSGNIGFTANGTSYSAGTGVPVNANESVTIVIKDVLAEEKYYVKPEDATTIQFESVVISQDN